MTFYNHRKIVLGFTACRSTSADLNNHPVSIVLFFFSSLGEKRLKYAFVEA